MAITRAAAALACLASLGGQAALSAQDRAEPTNIEWWHPVAVGAGTAALFLVDEPLRDWLQDHRSDAADDIADFAKDFKSDWVTGVAGGGAVALGLVLEEPKVAVTGVHVFASYGLSAAMMVGTKWALGRSRPRDEPDDPTVFDLFGGNTDASLPSGSSAVVFSLATTLADAIDRTPVTVLLYAGASLNAWARLNSDRHWLSDVALGAVYGITAAKLVNGSWTVFGLRPPQIWTDGRTTSMGYVVGL